MPGGVRVELTPHDPVTSGVLYCGLPDWPEMPFVLDYLRAGDVMVDVGANVGLYSLLAAGVGGVSAVAFEPDAQARGRAQGNVDRNDMAGRIDIRAQAVGNDPGPARLTTGLGPRNRLAADLGSGVPAVQTVEVVTLDEAVSGPVALVKVDVEGDELAVLVGGNRLLQTNRPALILEANDPAGLTAHLESLGYCWVHYEPDGRRLTAGAPPARGQNGIAVANLAAAQARLDSRSSTKMLS